jgi:hypothetical protein
MGLRGYPRVFSVSCRGPVAQGLERAAHNRLVAGSNPAGPTTSGILSVQEPFAGGASDEAESPVPGDPLNLIRFVPA